MTPQSSPSHVPSPSTDVPRTADVPTPAQREPVETIYEKSVPGRRAAAIPAADVPEIPLEDLIPASSLRAAPAELPEISEPEIVRHYNRISRRNFDLDTGFYPLGSCTMKHNPRPERARRGAARPRPAAPRAGPSPGAGRARADVEPPGGAGRDLRPAVRQPAALGGLARRARGADADPRLPRRPRRGPDRGAHPRHGTRDQSGDGDDGRLRGRQGGDRRARRHRRRRPPRQGLRAHRVPDADQPQHARPLRLQHPRDRVGSSTKPAAPSTTTAPT